jgi:hypothetical protein
MAYNGGDVGRFQAGKTYWFSITAVYEDGTATSNVLEISVPEGPTPEPTPELVAPQVFASAVEDHVVIEWNRIEDARLVGFKVVASLSNAHPVYPDDGYLHWIPDPTCGRETAHLQDVYSGGDFDGAFVAGTAYWFSVTAVYEIDGCWVKVAGNAVQIVFPGDPVG